MQNVQFIRQVQAKVNLTANQWELYACSMDCTEAAYELNRIAERAISSSKDSSEAMQVMLETARKYSDFGALDSEPLYVMRRLFAEAFGEEW